MIRVSGKINQTIVTSDADRQYLQRFEEQVGMLTGMIEEAFVTSPTFLLSPVMRQMMIDKGREVKGMLETLRYKLCADNLHEDFK